MAKVGMGIFMGSGLDRVRANKVIKRKKKGIKTDNYDRAVREYKRNHIHYVEDALKRIHDGFESEIRFVKSLLNQVRKKGSLSTKQWLVLDKILKKTVVKYETKSESSKKKKALSKSETRELIERDLNKFSIQKVPAASALEDKKMH